MRFLRALALTAALGAAGMGMAWHAREESDACPTEQFVDGVPPQITVSALTRDSRRLCGSFFSVLYSGVTLTPLYSAEHVTARTMMASEALPRHNRFHADRRLGISGPSLQDYAQTDFDRGHLTPNGDMPDPNSQYESFALSNIVPQNPDNNRHLWADIEETTRRMVLTHGEGYIVTGAAFLGEVDRIHRVAVPSHLWKAVYLPGPDLAAAWFSPNQDGHQYEVVSIATLRERTGIDPFPSLPEPVKTKGADFPVPRYQRRRYEAVGHHE